MALESGMLSGAYLYGERTMNLYSLREAVRTKTAYPERGDTGKARLNRVINYSLRQLRRDAPEALFSEEWRFGLEPA